MAPTTTFDDAQRRARPVRLIAFSWGCFFFFPVGVLYLHLVLLLGAISIAPDLAQRVRSLRSSGFVLPVGLLLGWTFLVAALGDVSPEMLTRLFHTVRVALVLFLGLMLSRTEARFALAGFLSGALLAALIVALHHVWGLPEWEIWRSLIAPRNNFSSGNMISMAIAVGVGLCLVVRSASGPGERWLAMVAVSVLGATVAMHAQSRNAQVLLVVGMLVAVLYRYRSLRATLAGLALALAVAALAWQASPRMQDRFAEVADNMQAAEVESKYNSSIGVRWRMYQEAFSGMRQHPVFGTGVGSWLPRWKSVWGSLNQNLAPEENVRFASINNPHNDFLLAGMETGVLGMLLPIWMLARFVRTGWRQRSTAGGITVVFAVAITVTALVNAPLRDAALGMTWLWLLGASVAGHEEPAHD